MPLISGQITIIPKPEFLWGILGTLPLLNHHFSRDAEVVII